MSAVCVLAPIVIGSWPMISAAVVGAAAGMGFSIVGGAGAHARQAQAVSHAQGEGRLRVQAEIENSEVFAETLKRGETITVMKEDVSITISADQRGKISTCVEGPRSKNELKKIGEEFVGRMTQQFAYHKLMSELKTRNFTVVQEKVEGDQSIQIRVRTE